MDGPIIAGVGTDSSLDAVALAGRLARATGDRLIVVCVYPTGRRSASGDVADAVPDDAAKALDSARGVVGDLTADFQAVPSGSPARGLAAVAEEVGASVVVVGSHRTGIAGRLAAGGTGERLLHGSHCPVAVAPLGYRPPDELQRLGVAFVDTAESHAAVRVAADLAARSGLPLTVLSVVNVHPTWWVPQQAIPEQERVPLEVRKEYQQALDRVLADLPPGVEANGELLYGEVVDELAGVDQRGIDLLVCGSRGYGPLRSVLLGTVSAALVRQAALPVLVVPRGASE